MTARFGNPHTAKGLDSGGEQLEAIAGRQFEPAGDRDKAPGIEPGKVPLHGLGRIKVAFVQGLQPGACGTEGIHQGHLYEIVG